MTPRVLVVHNRYRSEFPSGENQVVDGQIALLRGAGVAVEAYLRSRRHHLHGLSWGRFPWPAVAHGCYRGSRAESLVLGTAIARHRRTWLALDRFLPVSEFVAEFLGGCPVRRGFSVTVPGWFRLLPPREYRMRV